MATELEIKRYSAYYNGWCLAFGEHETLYETEKNLSLIEGESQIGIVTSVDIRKRLTKELLGHHDEVPLVELSENQIHVNKLEYRFSEEEAKAVSGFLRFMRKNESIHMFLTSHFCYPGGTRIITFSAKKPVIILYKEIAPLRLVMP